MVEGVGSGKPVTRVFVGETADISGKNLSVVRELATDHARPDPVAQDKLLFSR